MTIMRPGDLDPVTATVNEAIGRVPVGGRIGVACSGGADSVALAHATFTAIGAARVVVIHIDHQLSPGSTSVADGVASWARGQGAAAVVRRVDVEARASIEAAARDARYAALADIADELELATIFVGHTARDQAETVLMRIVRGTGPAGLAGIPRTRLAHDQRCGTIGMRPTIDRADDHRADEHRADEHRADESASDAPHIVRPLLAVGRDAIDAYIARHSLPTWADPMNEDRALFRVRVRDELLPVLRLENPQLDSALTRLATSASEWLDVIDALARPYATWPVDCVALATQKPAIRKRAIAIALESAGVDYQAVHLDAIDELVTRPAAGQVALDLPDARVVRTYDRLELAASTSSTSTQEAADLVPPQGYVLRRWQPGDRMRPARLLGRSRKLSDLFIDAKVPRDVRSQARVVVRADGVIVWAEHLGLAHGETENVVPRPPE